MNDLWKLCKEGMLNVKIRLRQVFLLTSGERERLFPTVSWRHTLNWESRLLSDWWEEEKSNKDLLIESVTGHLLLV